MLPEFSTWYAGRRFKPGTRVRVISEGSPHYGRETTVTRFDHKNQRVWIVSFTSYTKEQNGHITSFEVLDDPA